MEFVLAHYILKLRNLAHFTTEKKVMFNLVFLTCLVLELTYRNIKNYFSWRVYLTIVNDLRLIL